VREVVTLQRLEERELDLGLLGNGGERDLPLLAL
jgi:hypothetical protein